MSPREPWSRLAASATPRVLSWLDREPFSPTYGSFDRSFWSWKLVDHASARFQQAIFTLAHLATRPGCPQREKQHLLAGCAAGITNWASLQHSDGSFDEAYPYERSLAATAVTSFWIGEAIELLGTSLDRESRELGLTTLAKAAAWLDRNDESHGHQTSHLAAAAGACEVAHRLTGERTCATRRDHFLERIYSCQSDEGWYEEYGGADPGYQTRASYYLARIWAETSDERLLTSLARASEFLSWMTHPDGTLGGEYTSRNTEVAYPAAFEILAPVVPAAAAIAASLRRSIPGVRAVALPAMDRWNLLPQTNNLHAASRFAAPLAGDEDARLPCYGDESRDFRDAGVSLRATARLWVVVGLSKGGVVKCWDRVSLAPAADCGWWARYRDGVVASSQSLSRGEFLTAGIEEDVFEVAAPFVPVTRRVPGPWSMGLFRLTMLTIGRVPGFARWVKRLLVRASMGRRRPVPLTLERTIRVEPSQVVIEDRLVRPRRARPPIELGWGSRFATIYTGSSRYASASELALDLPHYENEMVAFLARDEVVASRRVLQPARGEQPEPRADDSVQPDPEPKPQADA